MIQDMTTRGSGSHHDEVGIQPAGSSQDLRPGIARTHEMACPDAGRRSSKHNPVELRWHRAVTANGLRPLVGWQDVQGDELGILASGNRYGSVDDRSIARQSADRQQDDAQRTWKPRSVGRRSIERSVDHGAIVHPHGALAVVHLASNPGAIWHAGRDETHRSASAVETGRSAPQFGPYDPATDRRDRRLMCVASN